MSLRPYLTKAKQMTINGRTTDEVEWLGVEWQVGKTQYKENKLLSQAKEWCSPC